MKVFLSIYCSRGAGAIQPTMVHFTPNNTLLVPVTPFLMAKLLAYYQSELRWCCNLSLKDSEHDPLMAALGQDSPSITFSQKYGGYMLM